MEPPKLRVHHWQNPWRLFICALHLMPRKQVDD